MAASYSVALKNARMALVGDLIAGLTPTASTGTRTQGKIVILSATNVILCEIDLPTTPFSVAGGVATLLGVPMTGEVIESGTATKAQIKDADDNVIVGGLSVGTAGSHVIVAKTAIEDGESLVLTGCTITHG